MILIYGNYTLTPSISGSAGGGAAPVFLTSANAMVDGRTGTVTSIQFTGGAQTSSSYVDITLGVTNALDSPAKWGGVGMANIVGLPEGLRCVFNGVDQRLAKGPRGELCAWWLPNAVTGASQSIRIYNDVGGVAVVPAATVFAIGEVIVGRAIQLPTLIEQQMAKGKLDPTQYTRTGGLQLWQNMRLAVREYSQALGRFTVAQARGGSSSNLADGIDIDTLSDYLAVTNICAVCDVPSLGFGAGAVQANGMRYDQAIMQKNWMMAKVTSPGALYLDSSTRYIWSPSFQEAT